MATAVSAIRFEKPHSLSYQDKTRAKVPLIGASIACEFIAFAVRLGREFAKRAILPPA
jgi:hypothetical protein